MKRSTLLRTLLLIPLALLMIYLTWYLHTEGLVDKREVSREPLLEIEDFILIRYHPDGEQQYTLRGSHLTHYDNERGSLIEMPYLTTYLPEKSMGKSSSLEMDDAVESRPHPVWSASGDHAIINEQNTTIDLSHNIELIRYNDDGAIDSTLNTDSLLVEERGEKVSNHAPLILRSAQTTITGVGLIAYPHRGHYAILNDIKTTHEKNNQKEQPSSTPQ